MSGLAEARLEVPVSRFALYGERPGVEDPEFVHIEDIQSRSSLHDWRIDPHIHRRMFQVVHVIEGPAEVRIEDRQRTVAGPCAICLPGGVVHSFAFTSETLGYVVTVSEALLLDSRFRHSRPLLAPLTAEARIVGFDRGRERARLVATLLEQMARELQGDELGRSAMFEWLFHLLLTTIRRQLAAEGETAGTGARGRERFASLCRLIEDHYREQLSVGAYAERLAMSPARLNRLCRRVAGKTLLELLHDRLALEAQRHLIYSSASVEQIAYALGFADPAYFSRFFKRRGGRTPGGFRREHRGDP